MTDTSHTMLINPYAPQPPQLVRLRDIALLLVGGLIVGVILSIIADAVARIFTQSKFVTGIIFGCAIYGSWLLSYKWLAGKRSWVVPDCIQGHTSRSDKSIKDAGLAA